MYTSSSIRSHKLRNYKDKECFQLATQGNFFYVHYIKHGIKSIFIDCLRTKKENDKRGKIFCILYIHIYIHIYYKHLYIEYIYYIARLEFSNYIKFDKSISY